MPQYQLKKNPDTSLIFKWILFNALAELFACTITAPLLRYVFKWIATHTDIRQEYYYCSVHSLMAVSTQNTSKIKDHSSSKVKSDKPGDSNSSIIQTSSTPCQSSIQK